MPSRAGKIVIGNIFYDFEFLDPNILGLDGRDIRNFYKTLSDGKHLLEGNTELFPVMAANLAGAVQQDTRILITHCLPHPSLVTFRMPERSKQIEQLEQNLTIPFICNPAEDEALAKEDRFANGAAFRDRWNKKSIVMGSNVISERNANPPDGLVVIFGHNHRAEDRFPRLINGKSVIFCSYQYPEFMRDKPFKWENQAAAQNLSKSAPLSGSDKRGPAPV